VALTSEDRIAFKRSQLEIMPEATHAQFMEALLIMNERKSAIRKTYLYNHATQSDNNQIFEHLTLNGNTSNIAKGKIITSRTSYKMNGDELLASPL
jgi:hypothetical protein